MDPEVVHGESIERPEVTLERTRELLARSRATLAIADRQLSQYDADALLTPSPSGSPTTVES